jgi:predicted nucleic acid-binding protein
VSILIDTGVWFGKLHGRDEHHEDAQSIVAACLDGEHGSVFTTTDIVDEAFALVRHRARGNGRGMVRDLAGYTGFTEDRPTIATVIDTDRRCQQEAWPVFERHYEDKGLSFTDCTSLVAIRRRGIDAIASFDDGFDGLVATVPEAAP